MNSKIHQILDQITALEAELQTAIKQQEGQLHYRIANKRILFEQSINEAHIKLKLGIFRWFLTVRPQNYFTMPIIYSMFIPMVFFDLCVNLYQSICFPVYGVARVRRADYFVMDHQLLAYLNIIEKMHCMYCSYAVGLLGFASEVTARTEQYFCPIKHAKNILGAHSRYKNFIAYGDADNLHERVEQFRSSLAEEAAQADKAQDKVSAGK